MARPLPGMPGAGSGLMKPLDDRVTLLGIRHHGPGSARMVRAALDVVRPSLVLVEGPPDADALVPHVHELQPPVALLLHDAAEPADAAFWPFARFSPEWQALDWGARNHVDVRFADMPAGISMFYDRIDTDRVAVDPLGVLAEAAGFDDPERWWEDVVEHSSADPVQLAEAVAEAMTALREEFEDTVDERTLQREAFMRQAIRRALTEVDGPVVMVCGAWHVPALRQFPAAKADTDLVKGLKKRKIAGSWVPWSHGRLAATSGYGAGVESPGWYAHLWEHTENTVARWMARTAHVLRQQDLPASTASAVEAVRLADTLAALRGRPSPGLAEVSEATLAVLCGGDDAGLRIVHDQLVVGEELGSVGAGVPRSPLATDVERLQRKLRLPASAAEKAYRLDLRRDIDRGRSQLLRRLRVLDVHWGEPDETTTTGTFAEAWKVRWDPGLAVSVAAAARHGSTVEDAAEHVLLDKAKAADTVAKAAEVLQDAVNSELAGAVTAARAALDRCAAAATDALELLAALPALAGTVRYGSVRGTDPELLRAAMHGLLARGSAGLALACRGIDDETGETALSVVDKAHDAVALAADEEHTQGWWDALRRLVSMEPPGHGLPTGRASRLLWEADHLDTEAVATRMQRAVSAAGAGTAFVAGFLRGSAVRLAADTRLLGLVDEWLTGLPGEAFEDALPLLRKAISSFSSPERRTLAERVAAGGGPVDLIVDDGDPERTSALVAFVRDLYEGASA
jgi:hypothetical protein